ncbi:hypothetical protein [Angustibacter sp. Root456]|uniref:hypothetical protein n=1 Tax=Angustibacter sp. Root456 TaxID=1736539 RepID=UPI0007008C21|nr:hypothetical protein [Angustibacter sp. Root456]KQX65638.1 hypothetical protein ASD06_08370 [Angustibacter sp. Root456]
MAGNVSLRTRWPTRHVELDHDVPGLSVWAVWSPREGLHFVGHHLMRGDDAPFGDAEYEYGVWLTRAETDELARLLGVRPRRLLRALRERGRAVVRRGEQRWVRDHLGPQATSLDTYLRPLG